MILPDGFALPALPYLFVLVAGSVGVLLALYRRRPQVTAATITALAPWMAAGGALYALYQAETVPDSVAPLFGSPAVYISVGILAGAIWAVVAHRPSREWGPTSAPTIVAGSGVTVLALALLFAAVSPTPGAVGTTPTTSIVIAIVSVAVAGLTWALLNRLRDVSATGTVGILAIFGHTLDGISTAIGYDLLGFGEQTPLSRIILEAGEALPMAELIGAGWLFALVKVLLGAAIVVLFEPYVREEPSEGYALLGLIVAVGLGPGVHNLVLFVIL